jgi:biopolymer transport protein ExbB/TolQ
MLPKEWRVRNLQRLSTRLARSPILWGLVGSAGFYALIFGGVLQAAWVQRYFTGHPVEYMETVLFAIGLAVLVIKVLEIAGQFAGLEVAIFWPVVELPAYQQCELLRQRLDRLPGNRREHYEVRRLHAAVEYVRRNGSAAGLDDELKYLADADATRQHNSYGLFRVIIWAIPILGFLGTVIGITMALNGLDPQALEESMLHVTKGLGVKFDTTALALSLSMLLMFFHFFVERAENSLLEAVDSRVEEELADRFVVSSPGESGQTESARRMSEVLTRAVEHLTQQQTALWQSAMDAAAQRWTQLAQSAAEQVETAMAQGLSESLRKLAELQQSAARQADVLARAIEASGEVIRLEEALNRNLTALAGSKHIEQSLHGLAAAVHMLNARLAEGAVQASSLPLETTRPGAKAA